MEGMAMEGVGGDLKLRSLKRRLREGGKNLPHTDQSLLAEDAIA